MKAHGMDNNIHWYHYRALPTAQLYNGYPHTCKTGLFIIRFSGMTKVVRYAAHATFKIVFANWTIGFFKRLAVLCIKNRLKPHHDRLTIRVDLILLWFFIALTHMR